MEVQEKALCRQALDFALEAGANKARICLNKSRMDLVATLDGEVDKVTACLDCSMQIALFVDGRFGSFSTNRLTAEALRKFVSDAVKTVRMLAPDPCRDLPDRGRLVTDAVSGTELGLYDAAYENGSPEERRACALAASAWPSKGEGWELVSEEGEYSDCLDINYIIDSEGLEALHCETCFSYGVEVTVRDKRGRKYSGYWWDSSPFKGRIDLPGIGREAIQRAVSGIGAKSVRSGKYNLVVDAEVAYKMVSPILGALSGYSIQQNNSFLMDSVGKKVFPDGMTLMDSPHIKGQTGSRLFDSEGVATRERPVILNGVVQEYFLNTYISRKLGLPATQEEAIRARLLPSGQTDCSREDVLAKCGSGILVTEFNGGNSNSATGDFSYGIEGFLFKDGKIQKPVSGMLITGNFLKLWEGLIIAGNDARQCADKLIPTLAFADVDFSGE